MSGSTMGDRLQAGMRGFAGVKDQSTPGYTLPAGFVDDLLTNIAGAQLPQQSVNSLQPMQMYQQYQQGTPINQLQNPTTPKSAQYLPSQYISGTPAKGGK